MRLGSRRAVPAVLSLGIGLIVSGSLATTVYSNTLPRGGASNGAGSGYTFAQSSIGGGGFVNVMAADPSGNGVMLAGSDTAGLQRSTDFGVTWQADQHGSITLAEHGVAALLFDPATPQTVYAATGGGIMESQDEGVSWAMLPAGPSFDASNHSNPAGTSNLLERCTGRLLAVDDTTSPPTLYAASTFQGLWRYSGTTWTSIVSQAHLGGSSSCNTSLAWAPGGMLDVSTWGGSVGVVQVSNPGGSPSESAVPGAPAAVQELVALSDGTVWGAGYATGVGVISSGTWTTVLTSSGEHYMSVDGYVNSGADTVIAGSDNSPRVTGQTALYATLHETTNSGATWLQLPSMPSQVSNELLGPQTGNPWWHSALSGAMLGSKTLVPAEVVVQHHATGDNLWVSGYGGNWRLLGAQGQSVFYSADFDLGVTVNHRIVVDPATTSLPRMQQRVYAGNTDWIFFSSSDGLSSQQGIANVKVPGSDSTGWVTAVDGRESPEMVYLGSGNRDTDTSGEIFAAAAPAQSAASFQSLSLGAVAGGHRPLGIGVVDTTGTPTLVVPVSHDGVWTKVGSGKWTQDLSLFMTSQVPAGAIAVGTGAQSQTVYAYDRSVGIFRSLQAGAVGSWQLIWSHASASATPFLMVDKVIPTTLWVIAPEGLFRLDNAATSTFGPLTPAVPGQLAGLAQLGSQVFTTSLVAGTGLEVLASDSSQTNFSDIGDSNIHATLATVTGMDIAADGTLYIATSGWGVVVGTPVAPADTDLSLSGMPADQTVAATGPSGAVVTYTAPSGVDEEGTPTVNCDHVSGSVFPIGSTTVTCTASDADDTPSSVSATFTVTVYVTLSGIVKASDGTPVNGTAVHVFDGTTYTYIGAATMGSGGTYTIDLPAGTYKLFVQPNTPGYANQWWGGSDYASATVVTVSAATAQNITLVGTPLFTLSGIVRGSDGNPLNGTQVHVFDGTTYTYIGAAAMGSGGTYTIDLPAGTYKLFVQPNTPGYANQWWGGSDYASATVVAVSAATAQNITLVGTPLFTLSGIVRGSDGNPLNGTQVHVFDGTTYTYIGAATMGSGGTYTIALPAGSYKLFVEPNTPGYANQWLGGSDYASATVVTVSAATAQNITLVGTPLFTLSGIVRGSDGNPLNGTQVHVFDGTTYTYIGAAAVGSGGTYTIDLPAGTYKLFVEPNTPGYANQWLGGSDYASATVVTVSAATAQNITLTP